MLVFRISLATVPRGDQKDAKADPDFQIGSKIERPARPRAFGEMLVYGRSNGCNLCNISIRASG
jgi:hypothetical protein